MHMRAFCVGSLALLCAAGGAMFVHAAPPPTPGTGTVDARPGPVRPGSAGSGSIDIAPGPGPGGGGPGGHGGHYPGPGDTVPPGLAGGGSSCTNVNCAPPVTTCGGSVCSALWTPTPTTGCFDCCNDGDLHPAVAYSISFAELDRIVHTASACVDPSGTITIGLTFTGACEAHAFMSKWLLSGAYPGSPPSLQTPSVLACVDGAPMSVGGSGQQAMGPNCSRERHMCLACSNPRVTLSFNRSCMARALEAWTQQFAAMGVDPSSYASTPLLTIGATLCQPCQD